MSRGRVLVVEDDQPILSMVIDVLREEGYEVSGVTDGGAALAAIERDAPDLIVLDMRLPIMNGWDVAAALQRREVAIPLLVMTAAQDARLWATEVGAIGYLAKPFDVDDLIRAVGRALASEDEPDRAGFRITLASVTSLWARRRWPAAPSRA